MRLTVARAGQEEIEIGITRLAEVVRARRDAEPARLEAASVNL